MKKIRRNKFIMYIFIFILFLNFISAKSDKVFDVIGVRTYIVLSGSMEPKFYPGDVTVVLNKNKTNLKENDIITFKEGNTVITHRIVEKNEEGYVTKGDNNNTIDSSVVKYEDVIGKVLFHIPKIGYIIEFLSRPLVIAVEMILLAIFIIKSN